MFAISRDRGKVFLHQPDAGMAVPVLLDLGHDTLSVRVPNVAELENEYSVYDDLDEILGEFAAPQREKVNYAQRFSQQFSTLLRDRMATGKLTVAELRALVEGYMRRAAGVNAAVAEPARSAVVARAFIAGSA